MGTMRCEGWGQWSGLCVCEGHAIFLQWFKLKWKKEKKKKKKKTQLGLVEQVSSQVVTTRVGDELLRIQPHVTDRQQSASRRRAQTYGSRMRTASQKR